MLHEQQICRFWKTARNISTGHWRMVKCPSNVYLRRIHNYALGMEWLLKSVIPRLQWPKPVFKAKRAITAEEHAAIVAREPNAERRDFYELL